MIFLELLILFLELEILTFLKMIFFDSAIWRFFTQDSLFEKIKLFWMLSKITQNKVKIVSVIITFITLVIDLFAENWHYLGIMLRLFCRGRFCNCHSDWFKKSLFFIYTHLTEIKHVNETIETSEKLIGI